MTDRDLRALLEERVADLTLHDPATASGAAWRAGRRRARRTRLVAVGATAAAVAVMSAGVAVLGDGDRATTAPSPAVPSPTSVPSQPSRVPSGDESPAPMPTELSTEPDATHQGVPVWWSPDERQELELPRVDSQLPEVIDLSVRVKAIDYAVAAFSDPEGEQVLLTGPDGGQVALDIGFLDDVVKPNGYRYRPVHEAMLSPTGRFVVFPQQGSVQVYRIGTGEWTEIDTGSRTTRFVAWVNDDTVILPPAPGAIGDAITVDGEPGGRLELAPADPGFDVGPAQAYGRTRTGPLGRAQSWGMGAGLPHRPDGGHRPDPEFLSVGDVRPPVALAFMDTGDPEGARYKQCCPVASWLTDDTIVYESRQSSPAFVAWVVGTNEFRLVSRIEGDYGIASVARLWQDLESPITS